MKTITYNNHQYPIRVFNMRSDETGTIRCIIADTRLERDLCHEDDYVCEEVENIDEGIYFYVDEGVLDLPAEEICSKHLDIPFKFIKEYE